MEQQNIWAILISAAAFVFSIASFFFTFYWQYWKPGKLKVYFPQRYSLISTSEQICLQIPFNFENEGSRPLIVQDLRLIIGKKYTPLEFKFTVSEIGSFNQVNKDPIIIEKGKPLLKNCVFIQSQDGSEEYKTQRLELQAKTGNNKNWTKKICRFSLNSCESIVPNGYAY
jgi:hypothetical protein